MVKGVGKTEHSMRIMGKQVLFVWIDGLIKNNGAKDDLKQSSILGKVIIQRIPQGKTDFLLIIHLRRNKEGCNHHYCQNYTLECLSQNHSEGSRRTELQHK